MKEIEILFNDKSNFKSDVYVVAMDKNKKVKASFYSPINEVNNRIEKLNINSQYNYYITANSFKPYTKRETQYLFALENIVIDFDIHDDVDDTERNELIEEFVWRAKRDIFGVALPEPNVIHYTGRGVHFWWHIDKTSVELEFLYKKVIEYMFDIFEDFLKEYPMLSRMKIDRTPSLRTAGLFRLFGTYNPNTQTKTKTEILHSISYDLNELIDFLENTETIKAKLKPKKKKTKRKPAAKKQYKENSYTNFHKKRMALIEFLIYERSEHIGYRDKMLKIYFDSAIQLMERSEAIKKAEELNSKFSTPLNNIGNITKTTKTYKWKNSTIKEWLNIIDDELKKFNEEYRKSSTNLTRNAVLEDRKKIKTEKRETAIKLIKSGNMTLAQISDKVGLSLSTVQKLSADNKEKPPKVWEILNMSKATYYRKRKELAA